MKLLVFNCGSSSLKYKLLNMPDCTELVGGEAQRVGPPTACPACIIHRTHGDEMQWEVPMADHAQAFEAVMKILMQDQDLTPDAVGHRLVHGGTLFKGHSLVSKENFELLQQTRVLAPLHNPPAIELIGACLHRYPDLPQVMIFDTAFHSTLPAHARTYAVPAQWRDEFGISKYGFHGTSHQYVATQAADYLGMDMTQLNAVSCHLGSGGASLCAISGGQSIDNTLGYSPLQGLIMSTRCGDLDQAIVLQLIAHHGGHACVEDLLNKRSGVLGMTGSTSDIRDVIAASLDTDNLETHHQMNRALQIYAWRIKKYLGAYLTLTASAAGRPVDVVIFTDTIGETVPAIRWIVCSNMECFGLTIDHDRNQQTRLPAEISAPDSRIRALAIQTNEELAIARYAFQIINTDL
ncbi:MAG: acetate/propionate family kinase [Phycisphaerae bacterium]|nr:acetate/propionate family kinase [Phycisphaerae bacterium]